MALACLQCGPFGDVVKRFSPSPSRAVALAVITRHDGQAFSFLSDVPPPFGGSAHSKGMYRYVGTPDRPGDAKVYFGKATTYGPTVALHNVLQEMLANLVYRHFGCNAQHLILSNQPWRLISPLFRVTDGRTSGIHLMSQWIDGFTPFGPDIVTQLMSGSPITVCWNGTHLPVRGLGQIIAVSMLLNDCDCIGGTGGNVGYTIVTDKDTNAPQYAKAIKIDPGMSFWLSRHPTGYSYQEYYRRLGIAFSEASGGMARINSQHAFRVSSLPPPTRLEFDTALAAIVSLSDFRDLCTRPEMEPLFRDGLDLFEVVTFLNNRRAALRAAFPPLPRPLEADPSSLSPAACLQAIRSAYLCQTLLVDPVSGHKYPINDRFVNLTLVEKKQGLHLPVEGTAADVKPSQSEVSGRAALASSFDMIHANSRDVAVKDLFSRCTGSSKRVNIRGGAGIGKSACCQSVVSRWASGEIFSEFDLVVWVPLRGLTSGRYPSGDRYTVVDIIIQECLGDHPSPSPRLRECVTALHTVDRTLWILDGYDEIVGRVPDHLVDAFQEMLSAPNRILTGRPHAMSGLTGVLSGDVDVEVAGFKNADIVAFVEKFAYQTPIRSEVLLEQLRKSRWIWEFAHSPVNLLLLCHVFAEAGPALEELSLTKLYSRVESLMGRSYCAKVGEDITALTPTLQSKRVAPVFGLLSEIAYEAMKSGVVVIPGSSIRSWVSHSPCAAEISGDFWSALLTSGLLVQADGHDDDPDSANFHFLHLTLQEYFAAKRITDALCGSIPLPPAEVLWLRKNKYSFHLEVMWWFVGGLIGRFAHEGNSSPLAALAAIWTAQPRDIGRVFEARVWLRVIEEGRLWRLGDASKPGVVSDVIRFALPTVRHIDGRLKFKEHMQEQGRSSMLGTIRCSLEQCPLLCEDVIFAQEGFIELANENFEETVLVLGKAVLHADWVWDVLQTQLLCGNRFDWELLLPELFDRPEFVSVLRECVDSESGTHAFPGEFQVVERGTSHWQSSATLPDLLDADGSAVAQWMQSVFHLGQGSIVRDLSCQLMRAVGMESLMGCGHVASCVRVSLTGDPFVGWAAMDVLASLGPALLDIDWVVSYSKSSGSLSMLKLFASVGERGLSCDWLLAAVLRGITSNSDSDIYTPGFANEALAVMASMMPFIDPRTASHERFLCDWITAMSCYDWSQVPCSFDHTFFPVVRSFRYSFLKINVAFEVMRQQCESAGPRRHDMKRAAFAVALMAACGASLLSHDWYTAWLSRALDDKTLLPLALQSLCGLSSDVLDSDVAMQVLKANASAVNISCRNAAASTISMLCDDPKFRLDPRVVALLDSVSLTNHDSVFLRAYIGTGPPIVSDPAGAVFASRLIADGVTSDLAKTLARIHSGHCTLQRFALDARIICEAVPLVCISFYDQVLLIESSVSRSEHLLNEDDICTLLDSCELCFTRGLLPNAYKAPAFTMFVSLGGLDRLYTRMEADVSAVECQSHASGILAVLSQDETIRSLIAGERGMCCLLSAMDACSEVSGVQRPAWQILRRLTDCHSRKEVNAALHSYLERWCVNPSFPFDPSRGLAKGSKGANLNTGPSLSRTLPCDALVTKIFTSLHTSVVLHDEHILENAISCAANIALYPGGARALVDMNCVLPLIHTARLFGSCTGAALHALWYISLNRCVLPALLAADTLSFLLAVLDEYLWLDMWVEPALGALLGLCCCEQGRVAVVASNAPSVIARAAAKHSIRSKIRAYLNTLLKILARNPSLPW